MPFVWHVASNTQVSPQGLLRFLKLSSRQTEAFFPKAQAHPLSDIKKETPRVESRFSGGSRRQGVFFDAILEFPVKTEGNKGENKYGSPVFRLREIDKQIFLR